MVLPQHRKSPLQQKHQVINNVPRLVICMYICDVLNHGHRRVTIYDIVENHDPIQLT